ncbi:hypothetical protein BDW59DRAFT_147866 [Aspergillus cavernicola]|uniref:Uncharacterized protein n=1 Tax=Aspergillus cavernicola TaxID=176166 RepID=A0ABR4I8R1_9EURO
MQHASHVYSINYVICPSIYAYLLLIPVKLCLDSHSAVERNNPISAGAIVKSAVTVTLRRRTPHEKYIPLNSFAIP